MTETVARHAARPSFRTMVIISVAMLFACSPLCWTLETSYGVDKLVASNLFWGGCIVIYTILLTLPWLRLAGQEDLSTAQRMEKMAIVWMALNFTAHLIYELPWVVFFDAISAAKDQMWAYPWWSYMDGGDLRYATRDVNVVAMEMGASTIGIVGAIILWQRRSAGRFSNSHLIIIMALMVGDFYPTYMYYMTEMLHGFPNVVGVVNLVVKFIIANGFWLVMPWVVFVWAGRELASRHSRASGVMR